MISEVHNASTELLAAGIIQITVASIGFSYISTLPIGFTETILAAVGVWFAASAAAAIGYVVAEKRLATAPDLDDADEMRDFDVVDVDQDGDQP